MKPQSSAIHPKKFQASTYPSPGVVLHSGRMFPKHRPLIIVTIFGIGGNLQIISGQILDLTVSIHLPTKETSLLILFQLREAVSIRGLSFMKRMLLTTALLQFPMMDRLITFLFVPIYLAAKPRKGSYLLKTNSSLEIFTRGCCLTES